MKTHKIIFTVFALITSLQAYSWGQTGHRVAAAIAESFLTAKAQAVVNQLLVNEDMAEAATYADEMRSDSSEFWQRTANPWHYVNVVEGKAYGDVPAPTNGDAVTALEKFTKQLNDPKTSFEDKQLALKFIIHIIGDLHQPFHTGTSDDNGGGTIKLTFFDKETNLHVLWDSEMIDNKLLSYSEWTDRLKRKITPLQLKDWSITDPKVWIAESVKLRLGLYPKQDRLSWDYQYTAIPIINQRLEMAGVRIAAYLNDIFK